MLLSKNKKLYLKTSRHISRSYVIKIGRPKYRIQSYKIFKWLKVHSTQKQSASPHFELLEIHTISCNKKVYRLNCWHRKPILIVKDKKHLKTVRQCNENLKGGGNHQQIFFVALFSFFVVHTCIFCENSTYSSKIGNDLN